MILECAEYVLRARAAAWRLAFPRAECRKKGAAIAQVWQHCPAALRQQIMLFQRLTIRIIVLRMIGISKIPTVDRSLS